MNLADLQAELMDILRDPSVETRLMLWINDELLRLAYDFDLPGLRLRTPASLVVTTAAWQYNLTVATHASGFTFHKKLYRVTNALFETGMRINTDLNILDDIDPDHNETGTNVQRVAYELDLHNNAVLGIWPMANETLSLWFYRRPNFLDADNEIPEFPDAYHSSVLLPRVVLRAFRLWPELATEGGAGDSARAFAWWNARLHEGLYGNASAPGLLNALRKSRPVRARGPSAGMGLGGADRFSRWR